MNHSDITIHTIEESCPDFRFHTTGWISL